MSDTLTNHSSCCQAETADCSQDEKTYRPRFDIQETDDEIVLYGDLPGVLPEDLDIRFESGELSVRAKVAPRHTDVKAIHNEYGVGDFHRNFAVAETINADAISAELNNGVLTLHLPKAEAVRPRRIKVQT